MKKYQCYYNEIILCNGREYIGKRINTECFDTEYEAEIYCNGNLSSNPYLNVATFFFFFYNFYKSRI